MMRGPAAELYSRERYLQPLPGLRINALNNHQQSFIYYAAQGESNQDNQTNRV